MPVWRQHAPGRHLQGRLREVARGLLQQRIDPGRARRFGLEQYRAHLFQEHGRVRAIRAVMMVVVMVVVTVAMIVRVAGVHQMIAGGKRVAARPLEGPLRLQEFLVDRKCPLQVEGAKVQHLREGQLRLLGTHQACAAVDAAQLLLDARELGRAHEVRLVEQQHVGKADLGCGGGHAR